MRNRNFMLNRGVFAMVAGLAVLSAAQRASATLLTYTETATGSGTFNGTPFNSAAFTIGTTANTTSITTLSPGIYAIVNPATYFTLAGASPTLFTDNVQVVSNTTSNGANPAAGFGDNSANLAILFDDNPSFGSYSLQTPIGPVTGTPTINAGATFETAAGALVLNSVSSVSFKATAVPEPASLGLIGLVGVGLLGRRKQA